MFSLLPRIAYAAPPSSLDSFIDSLVANIINPIISVLFALALAIFIWGIARSLLHADDENEVKQGKQHMIWGLVGMFIMVSVIGILKVALGTFGIGLP